MWLGAFNAEFAHEGVLSQMSLPELAPLVLVWHWWEWGILDPAHVICGRVTCPNQVAKPTLCSQARSCGAIQPPGSCFWRK